MIIPRRIQAQKRKIAKSTTDGRYRARSTRLPLKPMPFWKFRFTMPVFYHITAQGAIANRHVAAQERGPPSAGRLVLPGGPFQRTITIVPESAATA